MRRVRAFVVPRWQHGAHRRHVRARPVSSVSQVARGSRVVLKQHALAGERVSAATHLRLEPEPNPPSGEAAGCGEYELACETLALSVDPYMRCRFFTDSGVDYVKAFGVGDTITSAGVGRVTAVGSALSRKYKVGDVVVEASFHWPWQSHAVLDLCPQRAAQPMVHKIPTAAALFAPPSAMLGVLGQTGLTAYFGIERVARPGPADVVVVSAAAGAVGHVACALAKARGAYVVGLTSAPHKQDFLMRTVGCDAAVDYRSPSLAKDIAHACNGRPVTVYWDNVGGAVSDAVIECMDTQSLIVLCGQIAVYNDSNTYPPPLPPATQALVTDRRITRHRHLVLDFEDELMEGMADLLRRVAAGHLPVVETVDNGLEQAGAALEGVMAGHNTGKHIVQVAPWPPAVAMLQHVSALLPPFIKQTLAQWAL